MPIAEQKITTIKTGRFFCIGEPNFNIKTIWFVCHGYAQLARDFLKHFEKFACTDKLFIAPEALNRFYKRGFYGEVGASWMTKEGRDEEIKDYITFINNIYQKITAGLNTPKLSVNLLGFSQGAATAIRVFEANKFNVDRLVLWAGEPPPDLDYRKIAILSVSAKFILLIGNDDKLVKTEKMKETISLLNENKVRYELIKYDGGHELTEDLIRKHLILK